MVPEETPAKSAHVSPRNRIRFNRNLIILFLKKLKDALEVKTVQPLWLNCVELMNRRNKLLVISDKYGWETGGPTHWIH